MTLARLEISDGTTSISFYDTSAVPGIQGGFIMAKNGLSGVGADHISHDQYESSLLEGQKLSRKVVKNRSITINANLYGATADDIYARIRAVNAMGENAAVVSGRADSTYTVLYQPHDSSYTNTAKLLFAFAPIPDSIATAQAAPGLVVTNVQITLICDPYYVEQVDNRIHNLVPDLVPFGASNNQYGGWATDLTFGSVCSLVAGNCLGPFALRFAPTSGTHQLGSPQTASTAGTYYGELWLKAVAGQTLPTFTLAIQAFISSVWTNIGTLTASSITLNGWTKYSGTGTASANPIRIALTTTTAGQIDVCGPLVASSANGTLPTGTSPVSVSYSLLSNGENVAATPPRVGRMYTTLDTSSDAPALTATRHVYTPGSSTLSVALYLARRSRANGWMRSEIMPSGTGVTNGGSFAFLDGSPGLNVAVLPPSGVIKVGRSAGGTDMTAPGSTVVMTVRLDQLINSLQPNQAPEGRFLALLLVTDQAGINNPGNYNFWLTQGSAATGTPPAQRISNIAARLPIPFGTIAATGFVNLGEIDLSQRQPAGFTYPVTNLIVNASNVRGTTGQYAWVSGLLLIPNDEAALLMGTTQASYTVATNSGMYYDGAQNPPAACGLTTAGLVSDARPIIGDTLHIDPGKPALLVYQGVGLSGIYDTVYQFLTEMRLTRRWEGPR